MNYLAENGFKVIALRDLVRYVDSNVLPADPQAVIAARRAKLGSP